YRQLARQQLGEGRLAVAVRAEKADAVLRVDPQVETPQHRLAGFITDRRVLEAHQRWPHRPAGRRKMERPHMLIDHRRDRLHPCKRLQPALRLPRLRSLGAETLDELLHVAALVVLLLLEFELQRLDLAPLALELVVAALVERQLAAIE